MKEMMKEATESLPEQIKGTTPSHKLEDYTGTFEHPAYGTLQVYKQDDSLYVQFMEMDIQLGHHHYDIFSANVDLFQMKMSLLFAYEMNVSGEFPSLQLHVPATLSTQPLHLRKIK